MNYSNFSAVSSEARTRNHATRTDKNLESRYSHEREGLELPKASAFHDSAASERAPISEHNAIFRRDGEFWTLSYEKKTVRLRDSKGLSYIANLLSYPHDEIHAIELARTAEPGAGDATIQVAELQSIGVHFGVLGDAGEILDKQAKEAYRRRIYELREDQAEAKALGQLDRVESAKLEIDFLVAELSRASGLGGRSRVAASSSERARQSVTHAIRKALGRIADYHPALAQILRRQIKTGTYCSYQPDRNCPIQWSFSATNSDEVSCVAFRPGAETIRLVLNHEPSPLAEVLCFIFDPWPNTKEAEYMTATGSSLIPLRRQPCAGERSIYDPLPLFPMAVMPALLSCRAAHIFRTERNRTFPDIMCSQASATLSSGKVSIIGRTPEPLLVCPKLTMSRLNEPAVSRVSETSAR